MPSALYLPRVNDYLSQLSLLGYSLEVRVVVGVWAPNSLTPGTWQSLSWCNIYAQTTKISCFKDLLAKWIDLTMYVILGNAGNMSHNSALLAQCHSAFRHCEKI